MKKHVILYLLLYSTLSYAQTTRLQAILYDGTFVVGYVDKGAYLNFTGPGIKASKGNSIFMFGMLPSLRFKEDNKTPKNSFITPNLGFGVTCIFGGLAIQVPLFYNWKTSTENGKWNLGVGIGLRVNSLAHKGVK